MFNSQSLIPFEYAVLSFLFGFVAGFLYRCYQASNNKNFLKVTYFSMKRFMGLSIFALFFPFIIVISHSLRRKLLYIFICDAELEYKADEKNNVSISESDKQSLVNELLKMLSNVDLIRFSLRLTVTYFSNLALVLNSIIKIMANKFSLKSQISEHASSYEINAIFKSMFGTSLYKKFYSEFALPCL